MSPRSPRRKFNTVRDELRHRRLGTVTPVTTRNGGPRFRVPTPVAFSRASSRGVPLRPETIDKARRAARRIEAAKDAIADLACRLIRIPTENPPGRCHRECADLLVEELRALDVPHEIIDLPGSGEPARRVVLGGVGSGQTLYLHGHYDVVPANASGQFEPRVEKGRIYGRGAADMKGGVAAMIYAAHALRDVGLAGRVEIVLVPDEETGGELGSAHLASIGRLGLDAVGAILGEPTGGRVWNGSRGALTLRIRSKGRSSHVGLQHEGRNAFEVALPVLGALGQLKETVEQRATGFQIEPEAAKRSILMLGGEVSGGNQFNTVPSAFSFTVDRRFNPEEDLAVERAALMSAIEGAVPDGGQIDVDLIQEGESSATEATGALGSALSGAVAEVTGVAPAFELCPGLLETRFYTARAAPALAYGPGMLEVSHGPEEYVEVNRLVECAEIYARTALRLLDDRSVEEHGR